MTRTSRRILFTALGLLAVGASARTFGASGGAICSICLIYAATTLREQRLRLRQEWVSDLRAADPQQLPRLLEEIDDPDLRDEVAREVLREGVVDRDGGTERFPYPASFSRNLSSNYWLWWLVSAGVLGAAAFSPLPFQWRLALLASASWSLVRLWRTVSLDRDIATVIEVSPSELREVWPDGTYCSIHFARPVTFEIDLENEGLCVRDQRSGASIFLSHHRLAFDRLEALCRRYAGERSDSPDSAT